MTLKGWMLRKVNGPHKQRDRDARRGAPSMHGLAAPGDDGREPGLRGAPDRISGRETMAHLGPYAILIAAVLLSRVGSRSS